MVLKFPRKCYISEFLFTESSCSSLGVGAFSENGPFRPNGEILIKNEYNWNIGTSLRY